MGPAQRFLRHSNPFASKSIRLQEHFRILTGEDRRIGVRRNVDRFVDSYRRRSPKGAKQDSPGNVETGSRVLQIGAAKRFLRHSDPFASISFRLQRRFWILTNEDHRIGVRRNVDRFVDSYRRRSPKRAKTGFSGKTRNGQSRPQNGSRATIFATFESFC